LGELLGKCVGLISHDNWRALRAVTEGPFTRKSAGRYVIDVEERTKKHFAALRRDGEMDDGLHPVDHLRFLTFWAVADIIYGPQSEENYQRLREIIPLREALFHRAITGGWIRFGWSRYLPTQTKKDLQYFKKEWSAINIATYEHATRTGTGAPIVAMMEQTENEHVSREALYQTLDEMLFANLDVTIGGLSWNLLFLAMDGTLQDELRAEIQSARDGGDWHGYLLSSTTLLAATVYESARLKPLAAFSVPQAAPTDRMVGEYLIPAGTNFIIDAHGINTQNPYWGGDATTFRPRRFLERDAQQARYNYWRFGFGPRTCLGKYVADVLIRSVLIYLLDHFRLGLLMNENHAEWGRKPETWISHPDSKITCTPL